MKFDKLTLRLEEELIVRAKRVARERGTSGTQAGMNVLFDTNVVLDALLDRDPWADAAVALFDRVEAGGMVGHLGATTVTTVRYIASRDVGAASSKPPCASTRLTR